MDQRILKHVTDSTYPQLSNLAKPFLDLATELAAPCMIENIRHCDPNYTDVASVLAEFFTETFTQNERNMAFMREEMTISLMSSWVAKFVDGPISLSCGFKGSLGFRISSDLLVTLILETKARLDFTDVFIKLINDIPKPAIDDLLDTLKISNDAEKCGHFFVMLMENLIKSIKTQSQCQHISEFQVSLFSTLTSFLHDKKRGFADKVIQQASAIYHKEQTRLFRCIEAYNIHLNNYQFVYKDRQQLKEVSSVLQSSFEVIRHDLCSLEANKTKLDRCNTLVKKLNRSISVLSAQNERHYERTILERLEKDSFSYDEIKLVSCKVELVLSGLERIQEIAKQLGVELDLHDYFDTRSKMMKLSSPVMKSCDNEVQKIDHYIKVSSNVPQQDDKTDLQELQIVQELLYGWETSAISCLEKNPHGLWPFFDYLGPILCDKHFMTSLHTMITDLKLNQADYEPEYSQNISVLSEIFLKLQKYLAVETANSILFNIINHSKSTKSLTAITDKYTLEASSEINSAFNKITLDKADCFNELGQLSLINPSKVLGELVRRASTSLPQSKLMSMFLFKMDSLMLLQRKEQQQRVIFDHIILNCFGIREENYEVMTSFVNELINEKLIDGQVKIILPASDVLKFVIQPHLKYHENNKGEKIKLHLLLLILQEVINTSKQIGIDHVQHFVECSTCLIKIISNGKYSTGQANYYISAPEINLLQSLIPSTIRLVQTQDLNEQCVEIVSKTIKNVRWSCGFYFFDMMKEFHDVTFFVPPCLYNLSKQYRERELQNTDDTRSVKSYGTWLSIFELCNIDIKMAKFFALEAKFVLKDFLTSLSIVMTESTRKEWLSILTLVGTVIQNVKIPFLNELVPKEFIVVDNEIMQMLYEVSVVVHAFIVVRNGMANMDEKHFQNAQNNMHASLILHVKEQQSRDDCEIQLRLAILFHFSALVKDYIHDYDIGFNTVLLSIVDQILTHLRKGQANQDAVDYWECKLANLKLASPNN